MRRPQLVICVCAMGLAASPVAAQLALPSLPLPGAGQILDPVERQIEALPQNLARTADRMARQRLATLSKLVRRNRDSIELDVANNPARKGELLVLDASPADCIELKALGFAVNVPESIGGLGIEVITVTVPKAMTLVQAQRLLMQRMPQLTVSADTLNFAAGGTASAATSGAAAIARSTASVPVGMIDGAVGPTIRIAGTKGFASGAPLANNHGSEVASLLHVAGASTIYVADVYGSDPAGGNALAIARALGWLTNIGSKVISISLVGPENPLLSRAVAAAQAKGIIFVAAVGNDGPAAPPAFPASYPGVIAVTGVDGHDRALIEAGHALHLDYAAPGADMFAVNAAGQTIKVRGTSFATPLVAGRAAAALAHTADWRSALNHEARDLGPRGADPTYGHGLLCGSCARKK